MSEVIKKSKVNKEWEITRQYQSLYSSQQRIDSGWEPFAITSADSSGVWVWLRKRNTK